MDFADPLREQAIKETLAKEPLGAELLAELGEAMPLVKAFLEMDYGLRRMALFALGVNPDSVITPRLCACGCGELLTSPRPEALYATGACRVRALRARQQREAPP
jgi:hypothetical protein